MNTEIDGFVRVTKGTFWVLCDTCEEKVETYLYDLDKDIALCPDCEESKKENQYE